MLQFIMLYRIFRFENIIEFLNPRENQIKFDDHHRHKTLIIFANLWIPTNSNKTCTRSIYNL